MYNLQHSFKLFKKVYTISMKTSKTLYFVNASNPCNSQQMNGSTSLKSWPGHCCKVLLYNSLTFKKTFLACLFTIRNPTCTNHSILLQIVDQILLHVQYMYYCIVHVLHSTMIIREYMSLLNAKQFIQLLVYKITVI